MHQQRLNNLYWLSCQEFKCLCPLCLACLKTPGLTINTLCRGWRLGRSGGDREGSICFFLQEAKLSVQTSSSQRRPKIFGQDKLAAVASESKRLPILINNKAFIKATFQDTQGNHNGNFKKTVKKKKINKNIIRNNANHGECVCFFFCFFSRDIST